MTLDKLQNLSMPQVFLCTMETLLGLSYGLCDALSIAPSTQQVLNRLAAITIISIITTVITVTSYSVVGFLLQRISRPHSSRALPTPLTLHPSECLRLSHEALRGTDSSLPTPWKESGDPPPSPADQPM